MRIQSFCRLCSNLILMVMLIFSASMLHAKESVLYGGGPLYSDAAAHRDMIRSSGFTTLVIWTIHVYPDGDLVLNDQKLVDNGVYVGRSAWPDEVAAFKSGSTSVRRIEIAIGSWGVQDFETIESLIDSEGTGPGSTLYQSFSALRNAVPAIDAVSYDDESNYDIDSSVALSLMLNDLGYNISLCPYTYSSYWSSVYSQVQNQRPGIIDRIDLQCYAGGAWNDPGTWNGYFGGLHVSPGLWCYPNSPNGKTPSQVQDQLSSWNTSYNIEGGFMWLLDDMLPYQGTYPVANYAAAINTALSIDINPFTNLITINPGFESGQDGWFTGGGTIDNTEASEGSASAKLVSTGSGNNGDWRSQAYYTVTPGELYRLTFDYKTASGATGNPQIRFRFYGGGVFKGEAQRTLDLTDGAWVSVPDVDFSCPAGAEYFDVFFTVSTFGEFAGTTWLDNTAVNPLICDPPLLGDTDGDCMVNVTDLANVASDWLLCTLVNGHCP